jgi:hypothetical protein
VLNIITLFIKKRCADAGGWVLKKCMYICSTNHACVNVANVCRLLYLGGKDILLRYIMESMLTARLLDVWSYVL